jgi:SAM-dependent methyltransferase
MTRPTPGFAGLKRSSLVRRTYYLFRSLLFDPRTMIRQLRAIPYFIANYRRYARLNADPRFRIRPGEIMVMTGDRFAAAGIGNGDYFLQDLWAARHLHSRGISHHVDVGSRLDGFVAHVLPFCEVEYVDIRPLDARIEGLTVRQGTIESLPYPDDSVRSLSCLHVIEHIGLGRYGDPIDPDGYRKSARELARVLAPGGRLLLGTPVGRERLCFDAHRVFDPRTIIDSFSALDLLEFHLIDDRATSIRENAPIESARGCEYGCGLFVFEKPQDAGTRAEGEAAITQREAGGE